MEKRLVFVMMMLLPIMAGAEVVEIDGVYYEVVPKGKVAKVTSNPIKYTGSVNIPSSVIYKGEDYSVTSVKDLAFYGCSGLTSITIPNSVTIIGGSAFSDCSGLNSITIPNSVTSIGSHAFFGCNALNSVQISDLAAWCEIEFSDEYANPLHYGQHLRVGSKEINDLVIPSSVTSIARFAFAFSGLSSVTIPSNVTTIEYKAFWNCSKLASVTIQNGVTTIGESAFSYCSSLTTATIPNSVTSIGKDAFQGCRNLSAITMPSSLTSIEAGTFSYCISLASVTIPNSVTSIKDGYNEGGFYYGAFSGCESLASVTIPNSVTNIGTGTFWKCSALTSVTIPNSVTTIGEMAFYGCRGLTSITIPNSVTSLEPSSFRGCNSLTSVTIPNSVTKIGWYVFEGCTGLTSVTIGENVTSIGGHAFQNCSGLTSVTIPNRVTSIREQAFEGCSSLKSVTIGCSTRQLYHMAFAKCPELTDVFCLAEKVPVMAPSYQGQIVDLFQDSYIEYATLHVPEASVEAYSVAKPWMDFKEIVALNGEDMPVSPDTHKCATPTIDFLDGELTFGCETEGVEYVLEVTVADAKKYYSDKVKLDCVYKVSVYAMKEGWENSNVATRVFNIGCSGDVCDVNRDGAVDVADISSIITRMANMTR